MIFAVGRAERPLPVSTKLPRMAAKKASPAMEFIVEYLKKNKKASYADVRAAAEAKKIQVYPIMYGRAQALLGLVTTRPRGQGKAALAKAVQIPGQIPVPGSRRDPGRPARGSSVDAGALEGIIAAVKNSEQAKSRYRQALERIQTILGEALA